MSAKSDVKQDVKTSASNVEKRPSLDVTHFKPVPVPRRRSGLRDDQMAISMHSITLPVTMATKLGEKIAILWSDTDKAIAIQKSANGDYKFRTVGKNKSSKSLYCKTLLEAKKVKKGRYTTQFDEKNSMLIARVT